MVNISERPAEAADRAVPGHWEGDLIIGKRNLTAIGTLVERSSGYTLLVHLPDGYKPEQVAPALAAKIHTLPETVRRSLTWDQGPEMRDWKQVAIAADIEIFFCDPHKPWQRGTNENTNGLLRQYFPEGQRPVCALAKPSPGPGRRRTQRPAPQTPRLPQTHRGDRPPARRIDCSATLGRKPNHRTGHEAAGACRRAGPPPCPQFPAQGRRVPAGQGPAAGRSRRDAQRP